MADLAKDAAVKVRGGLGVLPLLALLAGCGGGGEGGSSAAEADLLVLAVTPTNSQETLPDLSDPEVEGKVTFKFTAPLKTGAIIDPTNAYNSLTPYVQVLDQSFTRVRGTPSVDNATQTLSFTPEGGVLSPAQYTVTLSKFVGSPAGKLLNYGLKDYSTSFTVGPDVYSPVIRNTTPAPNQLETPLFTPIVITFNESINPTTAVLGQTVFVQDGGTNPPTQLNGTLSLDRNGFDLVFLPDPCVGLPPSTTVVVRLLGVGNTTYIQDLVGNGFVGDPANNNEYQLQFNTKGVKPVVSVTLTPCVNAPRLNPNVLWSTETFAVTNRATYAFDCAPAIAGYLNNFTMDVSLCNQVKQGNAATWQYVLGTWNNNNTTYNGDWEAKLGKPGEAVVDWRVSGIGDSYIYQVDEAQDSVAIINSGNGVIEGHFAGVGTPKGITISGPGATGLAPVVFVSNYAQGTVTGIPIGTIQPGQPICTAVQELRDDLSLRVYLPTGKNPNGVACEYFGLRVGAVVNQADNELQIFDPQSLKPINGNGVGTISQNFTVGENPVDVAFSPYLPAQGWIFAYVVNQGGPTNPDGSVSLWWNSTGLVGLFASASGSVPATLTDGIEAPGRPSSDPRALSAWVCNTASDDVVKASITVVGSGLGAAISLDGTNRRVVGPNPTRMAWGGPSGAQIGFVALAGAGQVGVWELNSVIGPPALYPLPGVSSMFSGWDQ